MHDQVLLLYWHTSKNIMVKYNMGQNMIISVGLIVFLNVYKIISCFQFRDVESTVVAVKPKPVAVVSL